MAYRQLLAIALRQTLDPGDGLSGFLSRISIAGLVLAVALLLAVMSVMNGFEQEMRSRILGLVPHLIVRGVESAEGWEKLRASLDAEPQFRRVRPFFDTQALLIRGRNAQALQLLGIEGGLDTYRSAMTPGLDRLERGQIALGQGLAAALQLTVGDTLTLLAPSEAAQRPGTVLRVRVAAVIATGTELDQQLALVPIQDAAVLAGSETPVNGIAIQLDNVFDAAQWRWRLSQHLSARFWVSDWTQSYGNLYSAIQLSRNLILLLMTSIIAVAAFNVVSSLVLVVTDRAPAIAMLRAMGARPRDILWVYLAQGALIGALGAAGGAVLGALLALAAPRIADAAGAALGRPLLDTTIYPVGFLPVALQPLDFLLVGSTALLLCIVAATLPAWRAARLPVAITLTR